MTRRVWTIDVPARDTLGYRALAPVRSLRVPAPGTKANHPEVRAVPLPPLPINRRTALMGAAMAAWPWIGAAARAQAEPPGPDPRWYRAAVQMRRRAESWGDQSYGAVLVLHGRLVGEGPSRVVKDRNPDAHAEREAIRDAQQRLGAGVLSGAVLYSTSRPCALCEAAAERAGVSRMYFGPSLSDGGVPGATSLRPSHGSD